MLDPYIRSVKSCDNTNRTLVVWKKDTNRISALHRKAFFEKMFAAPGEDLIEYHDGMFFTHGTSLSIMNSVGSMIQDNLDDLSSIDPTSDWKKWRKRALSLYYVVLSQDDTDVACMRLVYDSTAMIIEYLFTKPDKRCRGYGEKLIEFISQKVSNDLMVISTEDACPYWLNWGFTQEHKSDRLNPYNDTLLLERVL